VTTLVEAWAAARERLTAAGIDTPVIDARVLLEAATAASRADLLNEPRRPLSPEQAERLEAFVARRERREPVSHILGRKGFWTIMLQVGPQVLTPRPETELIVSAALEAYPASPPFTLLDLGVGSGAIALAILAERPAARGLGVDASEEALATARDNAAQLGLAGRLALLRGDWTAGLDDESFDLVVANPPYVRSGDIPGLDPEVRDFEPRLALDGGPDGLDAYRLLAPQILRVLKPGGRLLLEIGQDQAEAVTALLQAAGANELQVLKDLAGHDRVVAGAKKALGIRADNR
jgi:release factor glutamine methyltransferase